MQTSDALNVLYIEDVPGDVNLLREMLRDTGMGIALSDANSLSQGREKLASLKIDVIFLDLTLPDVQGLETVRQMRSSASDVPIVVMTGVNDEAIVAQCIQSGAQDYLVKGHCDVALLKRVLRYVIERQKTTDLTRITEQLQGEIIERKKTEAALSQALADLKESQVKLTQAQKMDSIGRLAGGVAHDFNNILTVMQGYLEILLSRFPEDGATRKDLLEIKLAATQAGSLTRQLLTFSRKQVLQPRLIQLNLVVTAIQPMLRRLIGEDIELVLQLDASIDYIKLDPGQIDQILMNLAANARDAMPTGGRLTIETLRLKPDAEKKDGGVMLCVRDNGCGMDETTQSHLFEPFYTTKGIGKGTGIGLATVYGIVQQSGGTIQVESVAGKGSAFRMYFPAIPYQVAPPLGIVAAPAPQGKGETILIVEDELNIRALLLRVLTEKGYRVIEAGHGLEALALFDHPKTPIDLVVTDIIMPKMGGREFSDALRKISPKIKILYMSGYTDHIAVEQGLLQNEDTFIQKPFNINDLTTKIQNLIQK